MLSSYSCPSCTSCQQRRIRASRRRVADRVDLTHDGQEVGHREFAGRIAERRAPLGSLGQERVAVALQQSDEHFGQDAATDGAESIAVRRDFGLLEDVVPKRRRDVEAVRLGHGAVRARGDVRRRQRPQAELGRRRLARRQADARTAHQVAERQAVQFRPALAQRQVVKRRRSERIELSREVQRLARPRRTRELEEPLPVDDPVARHRHVLARLSREVEQQTETRRSQPRRVEHAIEVVFLADHAVPEPIGRDGNSTGMKGSPTYVKNRRPFFSTSVRHLRSINRGRKSWSTIH